ncbi:MAG: hypothetical protein MUP09_00270 [Thiovulaceae bacterium]|nr:hypothetical protein [Sulfurimonadaceae bacterium]
MPPKQYQREDPDSDDEQPNTFKKSVTKPNGVEGATPLVETDEATPLLKRHRGHPKGTKNKEKEVYVEPEKISEMVLNNELKLTKGQQKQLYPKKKRTISDSERERIIEMGKKGREILQQKKQEREEEKQKKLYEEEKKQQLINAKKIRLENPNKKKQPLKKVEPKTKDEVEEEEYESDSESDEGFSTDTRTIKKATKKIQQINQVLEKPKPNITNYRDLSLLDKLNYRF